MPVHPCMSVGMCGEAAGSLAGLGSVTSLHPVQAQMASQFESVPSPPALSLASHNYKHRRVLLSPALAVCHSVLSYLSLLSAGLPRFSPDSLLCTD